MEVFDYVFLFFRMKEKRNRNKCVAKAEWITQSARLWMDLWRQQSYSCSCSPKVTGGRHYSSSNHHEKKWVCFYSGKILVSKQSAVLDGRFLRCSQTLGGFGRTAWLPWAWSYGRRRRQPSDQHPLGLLHSLIQRNHVLGTMIRFFW